MEGPTISLGFAAVFFALVLIVSLRRHLLTEPEESRPTLSAIRSRTAESAVGVDLLRRKTFVFVSSSKLTRRLDHRIEDEDGIEIGSVLEQPRPGRWPSASNLPRMSGVRLEVCDESGAKVVEIVRPFGLSLRALRVIGGGGVPVGSIRRSGLRRFALRDRLGHEVGAVIRKSRGYTVDYVIEDSTHQEVGTISDFEHIAIRLERSRKKKPKSWVQPDEHVLEITGSVSDELRVLMLGAATAVYLVLQTPFFDNG